MILVVVSASAVIFTVANNSFTSWTSNFSNLFGTSANQLNEKVVIEQVTFNVSGSNPGANLYVRNDGQALASVSSVYVTNVTSGYAYVTSNIISNPEAISQGSFEIIPVSFTPISGAAYLFTVATTLGNTVTVNEKA